MHVQNAGILGGLSVDAVYPVGSLFLGAGVNPNEAFSRTTWARFGAGQVLVGVNEVDADFNTVRKTGGAKTVPLATANLPSHTHAFTGTTVATSSISHTHNVYFWNNAAAGSYGNQFVFGTTTWATGLVSTAGSHSHALSATGAANAVGSTGGGAAHNNLQPFMVCEIWERVA